MVFLVCVVSSNAMDFRLEMELYTQGGLLKPAGSL